MEGVLAVITNFAADFAPKNWVYCNGQLLPINSNQALFSLMGTTYGGNGTQTFGLPDLRSRTAISAGQGQGLAPYTAGQQAGNDTVTLQINNIPGHTHGGNINLQLQGNTDDGIDPSANAGFPSRLTGAYATTADSVMLNPTYNVVVGLAGTNTPADIRPPFTAINYIICVQGIFPSRN